MNINQLNPIKSVNLHQLVGEVENDGTFKEILENVLNGNIVPLVSDDGTIIGGSYNMPAKDLVEDNVNKIRFERRYAYKPVMAWLYKALELKVKPEVAVYGIETVQEDGDDIKVILKNGEVITVSESYRHQPRQEQAEEDLPSSIQLTTNDSIECDVHSARDIRKYVKNKFRRFLAKDYDVVDNIDVNDDGLYLKNVRWGRKASASELD